jgi:hypothetical protein
MNRVALVAILSLFTIGIGSCSAQKEFVSLDFHTFEAEFVNKTEYQKTDYWAQIKGKYVKWTGVVLAVREDGSILIDINHLQFEVAEVLLATNEPSEVLASINKGDTITFIGRLNRFEYREIGQYFYHLSVGQIIPE